MLVAVFYIMGNLNADSVGRALGALGIEPGTRTSPGLQPSNRALEVGQERFNICRTRVHAIIFNDGKKIEESRNGLDLKWMAHDQTPREISYLDVEKWLSQHCQIVIEPRSIQIGESLRFSQFVTIEFIDGTKMHVLNSGDGTLRIEDKVFRSSDFQDALAELENIAGWAEVIGDEN